MPKKIIKDEVLEMLDALEKQPASKIQPWEESPQGKREALQDEGFYGTFTGFVDWLKDILMYGMMSLSEPMPDPAYEKRTIREMILVTGGFSTDERIIYRLKSSMLVSSWRASYAGGKEIYHIPESFFESEEEYQWLEARKDGVFDTVYRARKIRLYSPDGTFTEVDAPYGATLAFSETKELQWTDAEDGCLTIRPLLEDPWEK